MSNAVYCARYYAKRKTLVAELQARVEALKHKNFVLETSVNRLREENQKLRHALLREVKA
jgi:chaperonin cofactor prefoldin